ncbi:MAG: flagellar filament capping protein FliD [Selenomonadaceae bacterium]|nr:flagellar filament capping protein FliD [Selenomonadaceae bacterium]
MAFTANSIASQNYTMLNFAKNNGVNLFGGVNSGSLFGNTNNKKTDAISRLWNNYTSGNSGSGINAQNVYDIKQSAAELAASYDDAKKTFTAEYNSTMDDLKKAVNNFDKINFNVGEDALTKSTKTVTDKDGKTSTETVLNMNSDLKSAVKGVTDLVKNYNDAIDLFKDNEAISERMKTVGNMFKDTTYRAGNYSEVGINVKSDGKLEIDEEKLAETIVKNPDKVSRILGNDNGLAAKADSHMNIANIQKDKLFPGIESMFGNQLKTASAYTGKAMLAMNKYSNMGEIFNSYY